MSSVVVKSADREGVRRAVEAHVEKLRAERPEILRILWFGSWVTGIPAPGSDVDLCLILSHSDKSLRDRIPDYLPLGFPVGIDLFAYTEDEFERLQETSPEWVREIEKGWEMGVEVTVNTGNP